MSRQENSRSTKLFGDGRATAKQDERENSVQTNTNHYTYHVNGHCYCYSEKQVVRGKLKINRFNVWKDDNSSAWQYIEAEAKRLAERKKPISGNSLIEDVRKRDFAGRDGRKTRIPNDFCAIIVRTLAAQNSEMARFIEFRPCVYDLLMGRGGYHE